MIGILPAAGNARRIHGLPKFLLPIPNGFLLMRHLNMMHKADLSIGARIGVTSVYYDVLAHIGYGVNIYRPYHHDTMTQTVLSALQFMPANEDVLFGLPDTYIEDDQCYAKLAAALADCDVAVGVFLLGNHNHMSKLGMVAFTKDMKVVDVIEKPQTSYLEYAWGALAWQPQFWQYLQPDMPHVGYALMPAIEAGLDVRAVVMQGGYWDCGTFSEYAELIKAIT